MSTESGPHFLCDPVLISAGVSHGFGQTGLQAPENTVFSRQVHGTESLEAQHQSGQSETEADIVLSTRPGLSVGIVTADCVPILVYRPSAEALDRRGEGDGGAVAAIHAGWRGLASGVIERGLDQLGRGGLRSEWVAAVGPAARACCYEVDTPVREGLARGGYGEELEAVTSPPPGDSGSPGSRFMLDLPALACRVLERSGLDPAKIGTTHRICTICHPEQFDSYRRQGAQSGRLRHFITVPQAGDD